MKSTTAIPRSPAEQRDMNLTQQRLFSSTTNSPFARHDLSPIPTPYGTLYFTALNDESLNVERVMMARTQRLMEWDRFMNVRNGVAIGCANDGGCGNGSVMTTSKAIPIKGNDSDNNHYIHQNQHDASGGYVNQNQNQNWRHSYHPQSMVQQQGRHHHQQQQPPPYHHQNYHHQQQPMSLPNNIISNHLIHNYAKSPVEASYISNAASNAQRNKMSNTNDENNMENTQQLRDRMGSDPGYRRRGSGGKRVLSGLSLALMNDQQDEDTNQQQQHQQHQQQTDRSVNGTLSSSPSTTNLMKIPTTLSQSPPIPPTASNEEAASWKQRVALHHPPPSFFEVPNTASESPTKGKGMLSSQQLQQQQLQQQQHPLGVTHKYGYGYNNGKGISVPIQNVRDSNSPSPAVPLVNTPPQPMFIGSFPRHGVEHMSKVNSKREADDDGNTPLSPPFQNPDSLQDIATSGDPSVTTQSTLQPIMCPVPKSGVSGMVSSNNFKSPSHVQSNNTTENLLLPPLTKSDGLASSPFKFPIPGSNPNLPYNIGSAFSSLTLGKGSAMAFGQESDGLPMAVTSGIFGGTAIVGGNASSMGPGRSGSEVLMFRTSGNAGLNLDREPIDSEDMPFAIDTEAHGMTMTSTAANSTTGLKQSSNHDPSVVPMSLSSGTVSSQVVTSFAHKCATAQPLQLFHNASMFLMVKKGAIATEE